MSIVEREVSFIMAAKVRILFNPIKIPKIIILKSVKRRVIGDLAKMMNVLPVERAQV